jgi:hypothetical protein
MNGGNTQVLPKKPFTAYWGDYSMLPIKTNIANFLDGIALAP